MIKNFLVSKITRNKLDKIISQYQTKEKVLEIGSRGKPSYTKYFPNRIGVDIKEGLGVNTVASVYELPFDNNQFDLVLCIAVLEHLENPQKAIQEMRRVLKIGGKIIVSVPFLFPIHDAPGDYWRFTKFGLKKLFSEYWEIEKLCAETNTQEMFAVLLQRLAYQTNLKFNRILKVFIFLIARLIQKMPNFIKTVFGDITKKIKEPEAFASGFFLVAKRKL